MIAEQPPGALLTPVELEQLHDLAAGDGLGGGGIAGQAGAQPSRPTGRRPGGAREAIWWGFLGGDPGAAPEPWTAAERDALSARGVRVAAPGARRDAEAHAWRRPVLAASDRLVLVRWRLEGAAATTAHPLADGSRHGSAAPSRLAPSHPRPPWRVLQLQSTSVARTAPPPRRSPHARSSASRRRPSRPTGSPRQASRSSSAAPSRGCSSTPPACAVALGPLPELPAPRTSLTRSSSTLLVRMRLSSCRRPSRPRCGDVPFEPASVPRRPRS